MNLSYATINIDNLRLRTFIGFNEEEKSKQQDIVINVEIHYPAYKASQSDRVEDAMNYKVITKRIIELVENGRFLLLEKLVHDVLTICIENSAVTFAKVRIDKPHALRFADSVSLTLHASKVSQDTENYGHA
jgi:D-erythro-7,8-dihydroneopterin triphosphate epimerase